MVRIFCFCFMQSVIRKFGGNFFNFHRCHYRTLPFISVHISFIAYNNAHWDWPTKVLHFTRSLGGIPKLCFLLSVSLLKKYPHVGFSTVENGATEFTFANSLSIVPWSVLSLSLFTSEVYLLDPILLDKSLNSEELSVDNLLVTLKCRAYLVGSNPRFCNLRISNRSHVMVFGFGLNRKLCFRRATLSRCPWSCIFLPTITEGLYNKATPTSASTWKGLL